MAIAGIDFDDKYGFEKPFNADPLLVRAISYINGKNVLDLGCGEGADSVFLAKQGFEVDAIDNKESSLDALNAFIKDHKILNISIQNIDALNYHYPIDYYDAINCLLVGCCMKRSEFEEILVPIKRAVKPQGIIIMSLRNYLDPELRELVSNSDMIEPNTYRDIDDCCQIRYFIEKDRLKEVFKDFEILHYYEGLIPDKYQKIPMHGDSNIICRKKNEG